MELSDSYQQRFSGIGRLYGEDALALFARSHVCVVGIGGVGSWAAEALARTGFGHITLIDMDDVCVTNTNRQIHALSGNVGKLKTEVMAERIKQIKAALLSWCRRNKISIITTGGAGGQTDPTQIQVADLAKTIQDPLAAKLRERLKQDFGVTRNSKGKIGIDCVFSTEQLVYPQPDGSVCAAKSSADGVKRMDCTSGFGTVTMVTASFGFTAVAHLIKKMVAKARREAAI